MKWFKNLFKSKKKREQEIRDFLEQIEQIKKLAETRHKELKKANPTVTKKNLTVKVTTKDSKKPTAKKTTSKPTAKPTVKKPTTKKK